MRGDRRCCNPGHCRLVILCWAEGGLFLLILVSSLHLLPTLHPPRLPPAAARPHPTAPTRFHFPHPIRTNNGHRIRRLAHSTYHVYRVRPANCTHPLTACSLVSAALLPIAWVIGLGFAGGGHHPDRAEGRPLLYPPGWFLALWCRDRLRLPMGMFPRTRSRMQAQTQQPNTHAKSCSSPGMWLPNEAHGWVHKKVYAFQSLLFFLAP